MAEFEMHELAERRRYRGKVFLFERCILYTEQIDKEHLIYKGHYYDDKLGMSYSDNKFKLFSQRPGQQEVDFYSDVNTVAEWIERINQILMTFINKGKFKYKIEYKFSKFFNELLEKKKIELLKSHKTSMTRLAPDTDSIRSSMVSTSSSRSTISTHRSSSASSSKKTLLNIDNI